MENDNTSVSITINAQAYEDIINSILYQAPLEIGVEIAVYMLLYGIIDRDNYSVIDINSMQKKKAKVYSKMIVDEISKVPDIVIVDKQFEYNQGEINDNNNLGAYGIIEIKGLCVNYSKEEYEAQKENAKHFIWTNGISWVFDGNEDKTIVLSANTDENGNYKIDNSEFKKLIIELKQLEWNK